MPGERPRLSHRCDPWLSVCFADNRKLQARCNYRINDRPQVFYNTQFDSCLDMSAEQIAHGRNGQRHHIAACHPITSFGSFWLKERWVEFIGVQLTSPNAVKLGTLYRVQPARTT